MKEIEVSPGKVALVDDDDYEFLNQWKWHAITRKRSGIHVVRYIEGTERSVQMHTDLLGYKRTRHVDGNRLNNQRSNLWQKEDKPKQFALTVLRSRTKRLQGTITTCQDCGASLSDENWSASNQRHGRYMCKPCWNQRQRKYAVNVPNYNERAKETKARREAAWTEERWEIENEKRYRKQIRKSYGMSIEDYNALIEAQEYRCAICTRDKPTGRGRFHVDHCHATGKVRSLLCSKCNIMLGHSEDRPEILRKGADYLEMHRAS